MSTELVYLQHSTDAACVGDTGLGVVMRVNRLQGFRWETESSIKQVWLPNTAQPLKNQYLAGLRATMLDTQSQLNSSSKPMLSRELSRD
ncbi:MAG: hypothetical protein KME60_20990 [Cyanomargarita calcarea GSE-NOS-MK-12-04C]|uniref:Uncharacterized protein n=1 Tax=Cyanomargarita calcarea GSE-NOS-MK-12-04C TaxID=2839659 RepID=A0A951QPW6_9CYAN|nr:hypothetical protein [Cyanomargarita calcarea GSE-NOS-MK-12-04C]